jgi:hypothetical protein
MFYVPALAANVLFQLSRGGVEGIPNRDIDVFVERVMLGRLLNNGDLFAWHFNIDSHLIDVAHDVVSMRHVDHHAATHDAITEFVELSSFRKNPILDGLDSFQIVKADLDW